MADPAPDRLSQADFARRRGVSRKTVTKWKEQGLLALDDDGRVKVEATEWNLDQRPATYRGGTAHRPIRAAPKEEPDPRERPERPEPPRRSAGSEPPSPPRPADPDDPPVEDDPDAENLPTPDAVRRKENYLGLKHQQQYRTKEGELVERAAAEALFFETARDLRDAWIAWPARVAVTMADELKIDPRMLTTVLTAYVRQHLDELGEPEVDLPRP